MYVPVFFFNDTATTEIYTLSLHDALRSPLFAKADTVRDTVTGMTFTSKEWVGAEIGRHTSELQSHHELVCRLLLEKTKKIS